MPRISPDALVSRVAKPKGGAPVVVLLGDDAYLGGVYRGQILDATVEPGVREWATSRFSAEDDDLGQILGRARTVPMLVPRQVIVVSSLEAVEQYGDKARDAAVDELEEYLNDPPPFTVLVLEAASLDQRMKLAKLLFDKALVVPASLPERPEERVRAAMAATVHMARGMKADLDRDAAAELVETCNANLGTIRRELEKLATYAGPGQAIRRSDVTALVPSEKKHTVWELADMLANRDRARAISFLNNLLQAGEAAPGLVGTMAWMYRCLLQLQKMGPRVSPAQAAGRLRMRMDTLEKAMQHARKIPRRQLTAGLHALYDADSRLKSSSADDRAILEFLVARLIPAGAERREGKRPR